MDVVLGVAWRIVVDDHLDIVDVDAAADDVGGNEDVDVSVAEVTHDFVTLFLFEVAVHGSHFETFHAERASQLAHLGFLGTENDDTLDTLSLVTGKGAVLHDAANDVVFHAVVADVGNLLNLLGRLADGDFDLDGVVQDVVCQTLDVVGHGCREHDGLAMVWQMAGNLHDVVVEAHVEHAVGFVEDEEGNVGEVNLSRCEVGDESARCGDDDVGTEGESAAFLLEPYAVVAAIDGYAADGHEIGEGLDLLVDLLNEFSGWCHDEAVDGILRIVAGAQFVEYGQQIGSRLSCSCLCHADEVVTLEQGWNGFFLNGRTLLEIHGVERIENGIVKG